ncbi:MAG TPA: L-threonylcarbamoyladenylate synthase [Kofleriaceae bacterium]|nr:L-threonylcarbamoyladenylate synthase [Kofleriaceae bacterium]
MDLAAAARVLAGGGLVCVATESTYGLAADLRRPEALARLSAVKRARPGDAPFAVIAPDEAAARALARVWPAAAGELAARHWPGPLTLVVPARADLPPAVVGPGGGVGVRVSSHPLAAGLARALGAPITATSANRSGAPPATTAAEARAALGDEIDLYLDGGRCAGMPSTVVEITAEGALRAIRQGAIALAPR